jgi:hypothetical protein
MKYATMIVAVTIATLMITILNGCHPLTESGPVSTYGITRGGVGSFYGGGGGGGRG